jgi:aarF domain-containing kinase
MSEDDDLRLFLACLDTAARVPIPVLTKPTVIRFALGSAGTWALKARSDMPGSLEHEAGPAEARESADCTLSCALPVLLDIANGRKKPAIAYMKGLITVKGDRSVFQPLTGVLRAAALDFKAQREARAAEAERRGNTGLRVAVHSPTLVADAREKYAVYVLDVSEGTSHWSVTRRWSELRALERRISRMKPPVRGIVGLPRTLDFAGSLEPAFLANRAKIMQAYLGDLLRAAPTSVMRCTGASVALREFLSPSGDAPPFASPGAGAGGSGGVGGRRSNEMSRASDPGRSKFGNRLEMLEMEREARRDDDEACSNVSGFEPVGGGGLRYAGDGSPAAVRPAASAGRPMPRGAAGAVVGAPLNGGVSGYRVADAYSSEAVGVGGGAALVSSPTAAVVDSVGLLLERLLSAAACTPISAERNEVYLATRVQTLAQLRALLASSAAERLARLSVLSVLGGITRLGLCSVLPAALALMAAEHMWTLVTLSCLALALAGATLGGSARLRVGMLLSWALVGCAYGAVLATRGAEAAAAVEAMSASAPMADQLHLSADPPTSAAADAAAAVATPSHSNSDAADAMGAVGAAGAVAALPGLLAAYLVPATALLEYTVSGCAHAYEVLGTALLAEPARTGLGLCMVLSVTLGLYLFGRLLRIWLLALGLILGYYSLAKALAPLTRRSRRVATAEERIYSIVHGLVAPWMCAQLVSLRSVYVKFGQYIGGRADIVPPEWADGLKLLQDDLPPCPPGYLRRVIQEEFGKPIEAIFESLDVQPIASASVAQVHVGYLHPPKRSPQRPPASGEGAAMAAEGTEDAEASRRRRKVVLKLQHDGVASLMRKDMFTALRIARLACYFNASFNNLYTVLVAWEQEMYNELDFNHEANNLRVVQANLERAGVEAVVPVPLPSLVSTRAFAMSYEDGFKLTDEAAMAMHAVDKEALMCRIIQVYGQQLFIDGFFNADPHAGNLLVQVKRGRAHPVLLDFGMTVRLSETQRIGYAALAFAAHQLDICGLREALKMLGVINNRMDQDPSKDMEFWRFFLRDTSSRAQAQKDTKTFFDKRIAEARQDRAAGRERRKLESIPPSLIFFWRVIGLIRGLCAQMEVKVPYMELLASRARIALAAQTPAPMRALTLAPPAVYLPAATPLHRRLGVLLAQLCEEAAVAAGVQVCVHRDSSIVAEACAGFRGITDARGLTTSTPMPLLELSNFLPVLSLHSLVASGVVTYDTPIDPKWPGCKAAAAAGYTIGDALCHRVPLDSSQLWRQTAKDLSSLAVQFEKVSATPLRQVGAAESGKPRTPKVSGVAYATLLAGIIEGVSKSTYTAQLRTKLLEPLGLEKTLHGGGLSPELQAETAAVSTGLAAQLQRFQSLSEQGMSMPGMSMSMGMGMGMSMGSPNGASGGANGLNGEGSQSKGPNGEASAPSMDTSETGNAVGPAALFAHELPLNAGMVNSSFVRSGCWPGLASFGTARGLALLLAAAARGGMGSIAALSEESGVEPSLLFGERVWARGLQR